MLSQVGGFTMARKIKTQNLPGHIAAQLFAMLNKKYVTYKITECGKPVLVISINPNDVRILYPDGWYFGDSSFRNKHQSDSGLYDEITVVNPDMILWDAECVTPEYMQEVTTTT